MNTIYLCLLLCIVVSSSAENFNLTEREATVYKLLRVTDAYKQWCNKGCQPAVRHEMPSCNNIYNKLMDLGVLVGDEPEHRIVPLMKRPGFCEEASSISLEETHTASIEPQSSTSDVDIDKNTTVTSLGTMIPDGQDKNSTNGDSGTFRGQNFSTSQFGDQQAIPTASKSGEPLLIHTSLAELLHDLPDMNSSSLNSTLFSEVNSADECSTDLPEKIPISTTSDDIGKAADVNCKKLDVNSNDSHNRTANQFENHAVPPGSPFWSFVGFVLIFGLLLTCVVVTFVIHTHFVLKRSSQYAKDEFYDVV